MESLSCGKINFTRMGKSLQETSRVPRHSAGIALHASPNVFPWNGPEAILQLTPVSQASPSGSARLVFSGYMGARERDPQRRGLKIGSMEVAYDSRKYPGAPKASPGTSATRALSSSNLASSVVFLASALPAVPFA